MLLKFSSSVSLLVLLAAAQANAGIGLHFSGKPVQKDGQDFNFAVSSTTPNMMEPSDSPTEPTTPYFPNFVQLRKYVLMGQSGVQAPMSGGGGFGNGGASGGTSGNGFPGIVRRKLARLGLGENGGPGGFGGGAGGFGGSAGGSSGVGGGGTTSTDQTVSGTDGVVCVTKTGTTDPGLEGGNEGGSGTDGGGDGGQPNPSAVPEPSSFALWTLLAGMLVFGTRRIAG